MAACGTIYMARGLCYKPRPPIGKYPDGPMAPGEKYALTVGATSTNRRTTPQYLAKVDYDLWLGPAPKRPFNRNRFHYNWHWHWDYGNGDTGNQGPHQFDIARWGLGKQEHPVKISSVGGYFGAEASQETPDTQTTLFEYADGEGARVRHPRRSSRTTRAREDRQPVLRRQGLAVDRRRRPRWQIVSRAEKREGAGRRRSAAPERQPSRRADGIESPHYQNFIDAIRANDPKLLTCDVARRPSVVGAAAPRQHLLPRRAAPSKFDGKSEKFVNDKQADRMLTREYRKGFEVPRV